MQDFNRTFAEQISLRLSKLGILVKHYEQTESTNTEAKRYASTATDSSPVLFLADSQSGGRGRLGRSFFCRRGGGIYMSLLYFTNDTLCDTVSVTTAAATYVSLAIEAVTGESMMIKWVNDVYNSNGKVCGILVEGHNTALGYAVVVGIGINLGSADFPMEISGIASSLSDVDAIRSADIAEYICSRLLEHSENHGNREYMNEYRKRFMLMGRYVDLFVGGELTESGEACGVDDSGALLLRVNGEVKKILSGEVSVRVSQRSPKDIR